jgi:hypothetical protein
VAAWGVEVRSVSLRECDDRWQRGLLTESLEVIQHASAVILAALEPRPSEVEESELAQAS